MSAEPIFVVGCSRSGTTVLQSIISQHPDVVGFPETNILYFAADDLDFRRFGGLIGRRRVPAQMFRRLINKSGFTVGFSWDQLQNFTKTYTESENIQLPAGREIVMAQVFKRYRRMMDSLAENSRWVEKSPQNIFCLDLIQKYLPDAVFVHIIRDERDNIASLIDAANKWPIFRGRFGGRHGLEKAIAYYNSALLSSKRMRGKNGHAFVRYEDLVTNPRHCMTKVEAVIGLKFKESMFVYDTSGIAHRSEVWKEGGRDLTRRSSKFASILDRKERDIVARKAERADLFFPREIS